MCRLRERALNDLAGDGGVGRDRVSLTSGSVSFVARGKICVRAQVLPTDSGCRLPRGGAFEVWVSARVMMLQPLSRRSSVSVVSVGTSLLRLCSFICGHGRFFTFSPTHFPRYYYGLGHPRMFCRVSYWYVGLHAICIYLLGCWDTNEDYHSSILPVCFCSMHSLM